MYCQPSLLLMDIYREFMDNIFRLDGQLLSTIPATHGHLMNREFLVNIFRLDDQLFYYIIQWVE